MEKLKKKKNTENGKKLDTERNGQKIPKSTKKYQKVPKSTKKYQEVPTSANKYQEVPRCTKKYQNKPKKKEPKRTKQICSGKVEEKLRKIKEK